MLRDFCAVYSHAGVGRREAIRRKATAGRQIGGDISLNWPKMHLIYACTAPGLLLGMGFAEQCTESSRTMFRFLPFESI